MGRVYPEWKQTELSRSLLDGLSSGFTEEEKFAASVASVDPNKLPALLEALRMPKKLTEFALLFRKVCETVLSAPLTGKECFPFFVVRMRCGARSGLLQLCVLLKEAHHIDSEKKWLISAEAVRSLDFRSISAAAPDKSRVPELIEEASVRAIDKALGKFADQH